MSTQPLPPRPNLQHLKYQALDLLKGHKAGDPEAVARVGSAAPATLADAQRTIAREYGFASWSKLKRHVESIVGPGDSEPPLDLEPFKAAVRAGDAAALRKLLTERPALRKN